MKRGLSIFCILVVLLCVCQTAALAADPITVAVSAATAQAGDTLTVSGTTTADTWVSLRGLDGDGSIVYFSAVLSDASGSYSQIFKVPEMADGTLTLVAGNGSMTASAEITIYTSSSSGTSSSGSGSSSASKVSVTFDSVAQAALNEKTNGSYTVKANEVSVSSLSDAAKALIGSRPVYDLRVVSGDTTISYFGGGWATVRIPYTLASGEDANRLVICLITDSGAPGIMPNCVFDAHTAEMVFTTTHFSTFAVAYNPVSFSDVSDSAWYADYVAFLAARGIVGGNNGAFRPDSSITRAEFVTILARMSGDNLSGYTATPSSFTDVTSSDWYFAMVQWAYENGAASGYDGKFNPNAVITREQMAVMLYRYAKYAGDVSNAEGMSAREFSDYDSISSWAQASVQWAMNNSIIEGNDDGSFAPAANATRAQAAKMIAVMLQRMIES